MVSLVALAARATAAIRPTRFPGTTGNAGTIAAGTLVSCWTDATYAAAAVWTAILAKTGGLAGDHALGILAAWCDFRACAANTTAAIVPTFLAYAVGSAISDTLEVLADGGHCRAFAARPATTIFTALFVRAVRRAIRYTFSVVANRSVVGAIPTGTTAAVVAASRHSTVRFTARNAHPVFTGSIIGTLSALSITTIVATLLSLTVGVTFGDTLAGFTDGGRIRTLTTFPAAAVGPTFFSVAFWGTLAIAIDAHGASAARPAIPAASVVTADGVSAVGLAGCDAEVVDTLLIWRFALSA